VRARADKKLKMAVINNAVKQSRGAELKNLHTFEERSKVLEKAITVDPKRSPESESFSSMTSSDQVLRSKLSPSN
jgi:hypothetical protein